MNLTNKLCLIINVFCPKICKEIAAWKTTQPLNFGPSVEKASFGPPGERLNFGPPGEKISEL